MCWQAHGISPVKMAADLVSKISVMGITANPIYTLKPLTSSTSECDSIGRPGH